MRCTWDGNDGNKGNRTLDGNQDVVHNRKIKKSTHIHTNKYEAMSKSRQSNVKNQDEELTREAYLLCSYGR